MQMSLIDPNDLGIAYFDRAGTMLHFAGRPGGNLDEAEAHVRDMLTRGIYNRAVQAKIYRGRTPEEGEVVSVVDRPTR